MARKPVKGKHGVGLTQERKKAAALPFGGSCGNRPGFSGPDQGEGRGITVSGQKEKDSYTMPVNMQKVQERREPEKEEEFDAFEALFELRKGN